MTLGMAEQRSTTTRRRPGSWSGDARERQRPRSATCGRWCAGSIPVLATTGGLTGAVQAMALDMAVPVRVPRAHLDGGRRRRQLRVGGLASGSPSAGLYRQALTARTAAWTRAHPRGAGPEDGDAACGRSGDDELRRRRGPRPAPAGAGGDAAPGGTFDGAPRRCRARQAGMAANGHPWRVPRTLDSRTVTRRGTTPSPGRPDPAAGWQRGYCDPASLS